jgi:membrane protein YqaA with SNARE-associated domain
LTWLFEKISHGLTAVTNYLIAFGAFGLFAVAFLDSALVPLPGGADAVMLLLSVANPSHVPLYVIVGTVGSVGGCLVLYYISRRAGGRALERFAESKRERVKGWLDRYDMMSVLVAAVLPPPFPFKLFVISTGVFRLNVVRFAIAVALGRIFRFSLEGFLAARYGDQAKEVLTLYYPYVGLAVAILVVLFFVVRNVLQRRNAGSAAAAHAAGDVSNRN